MHAAGKKLAWIELPKPAEKIPGASTSQSESQHIEAIRSRLADALRGHRSVYSHPYPLRDTPFPLLRAYAKTVEHSPDFIRIIAHLIAGGYNSTVLYVVAYSYDTRLFAHVQDQDLRASAAIREIIEIANNSDLANTLSVLVASRRRQETLRDHVRFSISMKRAYDQTPAPSMLSLVDELGYDEVSDLIDRYGYLEPTQLRAIAEGISPALSSGAL